jgi:hypothetical protein
VERKDAPSPTFVGRLSRTLAGTVSTLIVRTPEDPAAERREEAKLGPTTKKLVIDRAFTEMS